MLEATGEERDSVVLNQHATNEESPVNESHTETIPSPSAASQCHPLQSLRAYAPRQQPRVITSPPQFLGPWSPAKNQDSDSVGQDLGEEGNGGPSPRLQARPLHSGSPRGTGAPSELMTRAVGTNHQIIGPVSGGGAAPPAFTPEYEHELRSLREASEFMLSQLESRINGWEEAEEEVRIWQDRAEALQERLQKSNSEFSMLKEQLERATKEIQERSDRQLADLTMEVAIKRTKLFEAYEKMATMKRQQDILFECIKEVSSMFQTIGGEDVKVLRQDLNFDFFDIQPLAHKLLFDATAENFVEITPYLDNLMQQGYILKQYIQRRSVDINNSHLELAVSLKTLTELDHSLSILVGEGRPDNKDVPDQNPAGSIEGSLSTLRAYAKKLWNIMDEAEHRLDLVEEMMDNLAAASQNRSATQSGLLERTQFLVAQQQELKMLEHNAMNDERVQLREVIESRDSEIRDLRSKLARLADENSSVQFQIRMRELGAKHQEVANSSAQTSQKQAETNAKSIEREVHRLKDANSKLQRQIEEHNLQNSFNEEKLRLQLSVLQDKEEIFQTEKASLTSQIQLLEARNKQLHADSKRALKEFSDLKASFTEQNHMYAVSSNTLAEQIADLQMNVHGKVLEISVLKAEAEQMLSEFSKKIEDERVEKEQLKQMMKDVKDITMKLEDDVCDFMPEMQPEVLAQKHQLPEKEGNNADLSVITSLKRLGSNVTAHLTKLSQDNVRLQSELQEAISAGLVESRRSAERVSVSDKCAEEVKMAGVVLGDLFKIALQEIFEMDALAKELEQETKAHQALLSEMHECVLQNERETTANSMVSKCSSGGEGIQTACEDIDMTGALVENISFQTIEVPTFFEAEREESDTNQPVHKTPQEEMRGSIAIFPRVLPRARALPVRPRSSYAQTRSLSPRSPRVRKHAHAEEIAETQNIDTYVLRRGGQASRLDTSEANDAEKEDLSSFQSADVRAVTCDPVIERVGSPLALRTLKDDEGQGDLVPQQTAGNVRAAQSTSVHSASTANIRNLPQPKAQSRGASVRDWISPFPPKIKHDSDRAGIGLALTEEEVEGQRTIIVLEVVPGMSADRESAMQVGSRILAVDGVSVTGLSLFEIREKISGVPGSQVTIKFESRQNEGIADSSDVWVLGKAILTRSFGLQTSSSQSSSHPSPPSSKFSETRAPNSKDHESESFIGMGFLKQVFLQSVQTTTPFSPGAARSGSKRCSMTDSDGEDRVDSSTSE